ncbi:hypothetical protein MFIFM68171_02858 [Madurella fahalii]|uniref:DUF7896 domain-containing protein n=1 Tax=Madurella fahalii TaxID=1157608 RepID=A0ABQ0G4F0_9PEZI
MSQHEVEMLRAMIRQKKQETLELVDMLNKAQSSTSTTVPELGTALGNRQAATASSLSSRPSFSDNGRPNNSTIPHRATAAIDLPAKQVQQDHSRPMKRSKTTHAAGPSAAASMMRSRSSISGMATNPNPFVAKGPNPITPPCPPLTRNSSLPAAIPGGLGHYLSQSQFQQPMNVFIPTNTFLPEQPQHGEVGREMDPAEFLSMRYEDDFTTASPISIPSAHLLSPLKAEPYPSSSLPSTCGSMTSGPTLETAMSRCNSTLNDNASISGQFNEMVRIQSHQSARSHTRQDSCSTYNQSANYPPLLGKRSSAGADLIATQSHYTYAASAPVDSMLSQHQHAMKASLSQSSDRSTSSAELSPDHDFGAHSLAQHLTMDRSVSKDSIKSNSSLKHRAKEALARQNNAAKSRHLQPKPVADTIKPSPTEPASSKGKDGKAVIAKAKYERPKHPKVMCHQCNENPEGFRGEHELRRHTEAKHKSLVRKWICRDPDLYGIPHSETAVKPLKDCKQCSQNKPYGAYYNAAAHLRRTHFKVKPRKGASGPKGAAGTKADEEKEKRGGKGGGDWPSMSELKLWMVEVTVSMDQAGALAPDGNESIGAVEPEDFENELADSYGSRSGLPVALDTDDFGMAAFAGVGGSFSHDLDVSHPSFQNLQGEIEPALSDMYTPNPPLFGASSAQDFPISASGFDMSSSVMSIDNYTSPVSSTATITQAGVAAYTDHMQSQPMQVSPDDLADLPFELTFTAAGQ